MLEQQQCWRSVAWLLTQHNLSYTGVWRWRCWQHLKTSTTLLQRPAVRSTSQGAQQLAMLLRLVWQCSAALTTSELETHSLLTGGCLALTSEHAPPYNSICAY
jgi:hypothetical protein